LTRELANQCCAQSWQHLGRRPVEHLRHQGELHDGRSSCLAQRRDEAGAARRPGHGDEYHVRTVRREERRDDPNLVGEPRLIVVRLEAEADRGDGKAMLPAELRDEGRLVPLRHGDDNFAGPAVAAMLGEAQRTIFAAAMAICRQDD
jgi:hypothetical protein